MGSEGILNYGRELSIGPIHGWRLLGLYAGFHDVGVESMDTRLDLWRRGRLGRGCLW